MDCWIQKKELDAALGQCAWVINGQTLTRAVEPLRLIYICDIYQTHFQGIKKQIPCFCNTTLPSVLLLVRARKKPSTCIIGDADSTLSASEAPCWSAEGTAHSRVRSV